MKNQEYRQVVLIALMQCLKALQESCVPAVRQEARDQIEVLIARAKLCGFQVT